MEKSCSCGEGGRQGEEVTKGTRQRGQDHGNITKGQKYKRCSCGEGGHIMVWRRQRGQDKGDKTKGTIATTGQHDKKCSCGEGVTESENLSWGTDRGGLDREGFAMTFDFVLMYSTSGFFMKCLLK